MKSPLVVRVDEAERKKLEALAKAWGVSLAAAVRRLVREAKVR